LSLYHTNTASYLAITVPDLKGSNGGSGKGGGEGADGALLVLRFDEKMSMWVESSRIAGISTQFKAQVSACLEGRGRGRVSGSPVSVKSQEKREDKTGKTDLSVEQRKTGKWGKEVMVSRCHTYGVAVPAPCHVLLTSCCGLPAAMVSHNHHDMHCYNRLPRKSVH